MSVASILGQRMVLRAIARTAARKANASPMGALLQQYQQRSSFASLPGGPLLTQMATENPYKDVVRYEHKNRKWNLHHVDFYSESLAIGMLENGLQPGDVVLSWLPAHFSESVRTLQPPL